MKFQNEGIYNFFLFTEKNCFLLQVSDLELSKEIRIDH